MKAKLENDGLLIEPESAEESEALHNFFWAFEKEASKRAYVIAPHIKNGSGYSFDEESKVILLQKGKEKSDVTGLSVKLK